MILEHITRRALAALRLVDGVTGEMIVSPLSISGAGTLWVRNARGLHVLMGLPGLELHQQVFLQPPSDPPIGSIEVSVEVRDLGSTYLPRVQTIRVPRDPDPAHSSESGSLFQPIESRMFLSPSAPTSTAWAVIRATVVEEGSGKGVGAALIRVLRVSDGQVLARGLADGRGEALIAVPGIPVTTWETSSESVLGTEVEVQVEVVADPAGGNVPNPDVLEANRESLPRKQVGVKLASGRTVVRTLAVALS